MAFSVSKLWARDALTAANTTIFTMPTSPTTSVSSGLVVRFTNVTAGAVSVNLHAVASGGAADTTNYTDCILKGYSIAANSTVLPIT